MSRQEPKNVLFQASPGRENAVLNRFGRPLDEFDSYGDAFHRAGKQLVQQVDSERWHYDLDVVPIVFLYRHALELHLKSIVLIGRKLFSLEGRPDPFTGDPLGCHAMTRLLEAATTIFEYMGWKWEGELKGLGTYVDVESLIHEFDAVDSGSYTFRYPTDRKGRDSVKPHFTFDVAELAKKLDPIVEYLSGASIGLDDAWDTMASVYGAAEAEMMAYYYDSY